MLISQCHIDGPPLKLAKTNGLPEANGPPHGLRGHCPLFPPLSAAQVTIAKKCPNFEK